MTDPQVIPGRSFSTILHPPALIIPRHPLYFWVLHGVEQDRCYRPFLVLAGISYTLGCKTYFKHTFGIGKGGVEEAHVLHRGTQKVWLLPWERNMDSLCHRDSWRQHAWASQRPNAHTWANALCQSHENIVHQPPRWAREQRLVRRGRGEGGRGGGWSDVQCSCWDRCAGPIPPVCYPPATWQGQKIGDYIGGGNWGGG